jgi:hypothetical protein
MPPFRAAQILEWVYVKGVVDPEKMTNLAKRDRDTLTNEMTFLSGEVVRHQQASDGVQKLLIDWGSDGATRGRSDGATERRSDGGEEKDKSESASVGDVSVTPLPLLRPPSWGPRGGAPGAK